jgi:hypothetical protein
MCKKTKVMRISRQPSPMKIMIAQKPLENVEYFNYLGSMINDARCTVKLNPDCHGKSSIQQEDSFHQQTGLKFKEETSKVLHWVRSGDVESDEVGSGRVRLGRVRLGRVRLGGVRLGRVRLGGVRLG